MPRKTSNSPQNGETSGDMQKEAEKVKKQLSGILEHAPEIIIITDTEGRIEYVNEKFVEVTGYSFEEAAGNMLHVLKSGETQSEVYKGLWSTITSGGTWTGEFHNKRKNGGFYWAHAVIAPITDSRGEITNFIAMEEDFTARKNAEEALLQEQRRVQELSLAKDVFVQNITHELKTPLAVILGNISLMRGIAPKEKAEDWARLLDMMERNAVRLRRYIDQILQLGKLDSTELKKEKVDMDKLIQDIYIEHLPFANMKGLDLVLQAEKCEIMGDRELLRLGIANFVSNAIKFTDKGSVTITLRTMGDTVSVRLADTGIGISEDDQEKLFQKFFKANPAASGSGIGLALSSTIFAKHNGKVNVKSELGKGSAFEVILPRGV